MSVIEHEAGRTGDVAWDRYGSGEGVPLVALHGWSDDGGCWAPLVPAWVAGRTVLTVDARGHGRTPLPDEPFTIAALAADAATVLRAVLDRPAVLIGHSMGGLVAEELALSAPELVAALVLEDPAWRVDRDLDALGIPTMLRDGVLAAVGRAPAEHLAGLAADGLEWPADELEPWAASKVSHDPRIIEVPHLWDGRDWIESLAEVHVPVTLLTGDPARGAIVDDDQVRRARELLGGLLHHVPLPTGHNVRREARTEVLAAVAAVLARADG